MNAAPDVHRRGEEHEIVRSSGEIVVTQESVFQLIRHIKDPEHDYTLEELKVVDKQRIRVRRLGSAEAGESAEIVEVEVVPTIPHCSMVGMIGLAVLHQLSTHLSSKYVVRVVVKEDAHTLGAEMTKQLADIERTASALENPAIMDTICALL